MPDRTKCQLHVPHKAQMADWAVQLGQYLFPDDPIKNAKLRVLASADRENWQALERFLNEIAPSCFGGGCGVAGPHTPSVEPVANGENACAEGDGTVADGEDSVSAGKNNTVDDTQFWSGIFMGQSNIIHDVAATAGHGNVIIGGDTNEIKGASDRNAILAGESNVIDASSDCVVAGSTNQLSGATTLVAGTGNISTAAVDSAILGQNCGTENDPSGALITGIGACGWLSGQVAHSTDSSIIQPGGGTLNRAQSQESFVTGQTQTINATPQTLTSIPFDNIPYAVAFRGQVVARNNAADVNSCWEFKGLYASDGAGGFRLVGSSVTMLFQDAGAAAWAVAVVTQPGAFAADILNIQVTGAAATTINWSASWHFTEVPGGI